MQWWIRAALAISVVSVAMSACGGDDKAPDPAAWASGICAAEQKFATAIIESRDDRDPSSLDLEERKQRAARLGKIEADAAKQLAKELSQLDPPAEAKQYHKALVQKANDTAKAVEAQTAAIEKATTAQQIAAANASAKFEVRGSDTELTAAAATLSDAIIQVLLEQDTCGAAPIPGETAPALPTPSA